MAIDLTYLALPANPIERALAMIQLAAKAALGPFWQARYNLAAAGYSGAFYIDNVTGKVVGSYGATLGAGTTSVSRVSDVTPPPPVVDPLSPPPPVTAPLPDVAGSLIGPALAIAGAYGLYRLTR